MQPPSVAECSAPLTTGLRFLVNHDVGSRHRTSGVAFCSVLHDSGEGARWIHGQFNAVRHRRQHYASASIKVETILGTNVRRFKTEVESQRGLCRSDPKVTFSVIDPLSRQLDAFQLRVSLGGKAASEYQGFALLLQAFVPGHQYAGLPMTGIGELPG